MNCHNQTTCTVVVIFSNPNWSIIAKYLSRVYHSDPLFS
jgi:hypothetical protein